MERHLRKLETKLLQAIHNPAIKLPDDVKDLIEIYALKRGERESLEFSFWMRIFAGSIMYIICFCVGVLMMHLAGHILQHLLINHSFDTSRTFLDSEDIFAIDTLDL